MKTTVTFFALCLIACFMASAQTGSFNTSITFNASSRTLSCYVPANYDSTRAYRLMVCLHGLGDNSTNYRNALITSLNWPALFPNTIFVCPDGGSDANKDFYQPKGDEEIIAASIRYATGAFHIDTPSVILQGFSLGGRSAFKYGLDHPNLFSGLLLNTPAFQGLMDAQNDPVASLQYNYNNAAQVPVVVTVGESDYTYVYQVTAFGKLLKKHNAPVLFVSVPGMTHALPNSTIMGRASSFLVNHTVAHLDADLFELGDQQQFCSGAIKTTGWVRNNGDSVIRSLSIALSAGSTSTVQQWQGTLLPNASVTIPLELTVPTGGNYSFKATIAGVNNQNGDADTSNNQLTQAIHIATETAKPIVVQTFDDATNPWYIQHSGSMFEWFIDDQVKKSGKQSISSFNTALLFYTRNAVERFSLPTVNIAGLARKELNFDLAFTYFKYTPPYVASETNFADTLEILVSTDCGVTFSSIYKKGGQQLATTAEPILNALNLQACSFTPTAEQWRTETIDLSAYASATNAIVAFNCISGMGGSLNIDNISFGGAYVGVTETAPTPSTYVMYPNPAAQAVTIRVPEGASGDIILRDITGNVVLSQPVSGREQQLNVSELPDGLYLTQLTLGGQSVIQKLLIRK